MTIIWLVAVSAYTIVEISSGISAKQLPPVILSPNDVKTVVQLDSYYLSLPYSSKYILLNNVLSDNDDYKNLSPSAKMVVVGYLLGCKDASCAEIIPDVNYLIDTNSFSTKRVAAKLRGNFNDSVTRGRIHKWVQETIFASLAAWVLPVIGIYALGFGIFWVGNGFRKNNTEP